MENNHGVGYNIKKKTFQGNGTYVTYPIIIFEANEEKQDIWNKIIFEDIGKVLKIYSAYAYAPHTDGADILQMDTLHITYDIKRFDNRYLSIFYTADFHSPYAAYPTQLIYTTNIDLQYDRRLRLSDFIKNNEHLVSNIVSWEIVTKDNDSKEYRRAVNDYIEGLGKDILLMGLEAADIIGPDNYLGIFSYLTPDNLGVSISVPNYLGDHVEFEEPSII